MYVKLTCVVIYNLQLHYLYHVCFTLQYPIPVITRVMEGPPDAQFVYRAEACDPDQAPNNKISYSFFFDDKYCKL